MDNNNYGVITEQGDLGLGFQEVSDKEKEILKENNSGSENKEIERG